MQRPLPFSVRVIGLLCVAFVTGCGGPADQPELGTVTGKVTLDGEPLRNVEISFVPETGRPSFGTTNNDGQYQLNYIREIDGAKIGRHTVFVRDGRIDNTQLQPVQVKSGSNVIDVKCVAAKQAPSPNAGER